MTNLLHGDWLSIGRVLCTLRKNEKGNGCEISYRGVGMNEHFHNRKRDLKKKHSQGTEQTKDWFLTEKIHFED